MGSNELWHHQLSKDFPLPVTDVLGAMLLWLVSTNMEMRTLSIRWGCSGHLGPLAPTLGVLAIHLRKPWVRLGC